MINIKQGRYYLTRGGFKAYCVGTHNPFKLDQITLAIGTDFVSVSKSGRFFGCGGADHEYDIVDEWRGEK